MRKNFHIIIYIFSCIYKRLKGLMFETGRKSSLLYWAEVKYFVIYDFRFTILQSFKNKHKNKRKKNLLKNYYDSVSVYHHVYQYLRNTRKNALYSFIQHLVFFCQILDFCHLSISNSNWGNHFLLKSIKETFLISSFQTSEGFICLGRFCNILTFGKVGFHFKVRFRWN